VIRNVQINRLFLLCHSLLGVASLGRAVCSGNLSHRPVSSLCNPRFIGARLNTRRTAAAMLWRFFALFQDRPANLIVRLTKVRTLWKSVTAFDAWRQHRISLARDAENPPQSTEYSLPRMRWRRLGIGACRAALRRRAQPLQPVIFLRVN
jgi:hypothetical protein